MTPRDAVIYAFLLAALAVFLARDWIRARFKRNVPGPRFAGANRNPPPPCVPIQRPNYPPMPLPTPPTPEEEASRVADLGESVAAAARLYAEGHPETREEIDAERERIAAEHSRAEKIILMAERLFVEHRCDPEQAYADAVRWVDSRVATALAEGRGPEAAREGARATEATEMFFAADPSPFNPSTSVTSSWHCSGCGRFYDDILDLFADGSDVAACPVCAERDALNARMSREPIIATVNEFHWRIDPEAEIPTARGGEDGCLVRFNGEAFEFEQPASYAYPPDLPATAADALRNAWHAREFLTTHGPAKSSPHADVGIHPSNATTSERREQPGRRPELDGPHRGPDIDRLLAIAELLHEFDAHALLNLATTQDPELASRIDARKANDHLRRALVAGQLDVVRPGKRGTAGYMPTYRLSVADEVPQEEKADAAARANPEPDTEDAEPRPAISSPPRGAVLFRCMVHHRDVEQGMICPECVARPRVPAREAR